MLIDGLRLSDSGVIANAKVASGPSFPADPVKGEMFYLDTAFSTYNIGLYVFDGSGWVTGDVSSVTAGYGLLGGGLGGDITVNIDPSVVAQKTDIQNLQTGLNNTNTGLGAHTSNATVHLTAAQNALLDAIEGQVTATELLNVAGSTGNLQAQISAEVSARTTADNAQAAATLAEKNRAEAAEAALGESLSDEIARALSAEATLQAAVNSEQIRAQAAEAALNLKVDNEVTNRTSADNALSANITNVAGEHTNDKTAQSLKDASQDAAIATKVSKAGDTMAGILNMGDNRITAVADPVDAKDAANKGYVDARLTGLKWRDPVRTINLLSAIRQVQPSVALKGDTYIVKGPASGAWAAFAGGDVVQFNATGAVTDAASWTLVQAVAVGDRFVVAGTTTTPPDAPLLNNDIVTWNGSDFTTETPTDGLSLYVSDADAYEFGQSFVFQSDEANWVQFTGPSQVGAGTGLQFAGNTLNVVLGAGIKELPSDEVGLDVRTTGGVFTTLDGVNASSASEAQLALKLDGNTLTLSAAGVKVSDSIPSSIVTLNAKVDSEIANRIAADNDLSADISAEATQRQAGDASLTADLTAETNRAVAAEAGIAADVGTLTTSLSNHAADQTKHLTATQNTLLDGITVTFAEVNRLSGVTGNVQGQIDSANTARTLADNTLQSNIDNEANARQSADTVLQTNISTVATNLATHEADSGKHLTAAQNALLDGIVSTLTAVEINFLDGVTSPIQAQIDNLSGDLSGDISSHIGDNARHLTTAQNTLLDGINAAVTSTEINQLAGLTGNVQTQLNAGVSALDSHSADNDRHLTAAQNALLDGISTLISAQEINYLDGLTGNIQTQLNNEVSTRTSAVNTVMGNLGIEQTERQTADANLQSQITAEVNARTAHAGDDARHLTPAQNALIDGIAASITAAEINYLDGVTSPIQTQIDNEIAARGAADVTLTNAVNTKFDKAGGTISGDVSVTGKIVGKKVELALGEGLHLDEDLNYFGAGQDARIIRMVDVDGTGGVVDGGLVIQAHTTTDNTKTEIVAIRTNGVFTYKGNTVWHAGNDGAGSGLDADLLDGVQGASFVRKDADSTVTSFLSVSQTPTAGTHVANKDYVDGQITALIGGAPGTLNTLQELAAAINNDANVASTLSTQIATKVGKAGDTMTGFLTLHADPSSSMHAATKGYVDTAIANAPKEIFAEVTAAITAQKGYVYFVNTSGGAITITLPVSPVMGDTIEFIDAAGTFATNNLTLARNGKTIMSLAENMTVSDNFASFKLRYYNATHGWRIIGA